jgi:hypothetical protein
MEPGALVLHDLRDGLRRGFSFQTSQQATIHPSGEMVAVRTAEEVQLLLPDGEVLSRVAFPGKVHHLAYEALTFSACGKHLWFAHAPAEGAHYLYLLRVPSLETLDRAVAPHDPNSYRDSPEAGWRELSAFVNPVTNRLFLKRTTGDSYLSVSSLRARRGKIADLRHLAAEDPEFNSDPIHALTFAPDGERFAGYDRYGAIYEWSWPECRVESSQWDHQLRNSDEDWVNLEAIAYSGSLVLLTLGRQLHVLRSGSLAPVGVLPSWMAGLSLLPNGMPVEVTGEETLEILALRPARKGVPVVVELDSEFGTADRVVRRTKSGWQDVTRQVVWVEPNFALAGRA